METFVKLQKSGIIQLLEHPIPAHRPRAVPRPKNLQVPISRKPRVEA